MPRQKSTHVDSPAAVGERLKAARERVGLSQRQLSFPGCSPAYISRIESGDRIPSLQLLRELGRRLNVTEDFLATGADGPFEHSALLTEAEVLLRLNELEAAGSNTPRRSSRARTAPSGRRRSPGSDTSSSGAAGRARRSRGSKARSRHRLRTSRTTRIWPTTSAAPTPWSASSSPR